MKITKSAERFLSRKRLLHIGGGKICSMSFSARSPHEKVTSQ